MEQTGDLHSATSGAMKDPVCGMTVDAATAQWSHRHAGRTYYFCSKDCMVKFAAHPDGYLTQAVAHSEQSASGVHARPPSSSTIYTCPMHPEVRRSAPGSCPICGMALE